MTNLTPGMDGAQHRVNEACEIALEATRFPARLRVAFQMALDFIAIPPGRQENYPANLLTGCGGGLGFFHFFDDGVGKFRCSGLPADVTGELLVMAVHLF